MRPLIECIRVRPTASSAVVDGGHRRGRFNTFLLSLRFCNMCWLLWVNNKPLTAGRWPCGIYHTQGKLFQAPKCRCASRIFTVTSRHTVTTTATHILWRPQDWPPAACTDVLGLLGRVLPALGHVAPIGYVSILVRCPAHQHHARGVRTRSTCSLSHLRVWDALGRKLASAFLSWPHALGGAAAFNSLHSYGNRHAFAAPFLPLDRP
ncbi:hypothetical protein C8Q79DRAFT_199537 [Trametes meyenii]|nr:hypothetical protein C8Q79DRAFT_199537 [Trametes meyenii]